MRVRFSLKCTDRKTNFVLLHIINLEMDKLARELIVTINDELERYEQLPRSRLDRKLLRDCIRRKEISEMYTGAVERAMLQEK